jgi:PEP-CTERM motif
LTELNLKEGSILKMRIAALTLLCLALAAMPAWAQWSYNNGPINGTTDAWTINFGYIVSDSYVAGGNNVTDFQVGVWEYPGDSMSSLDWSITLDENGGTVFGSGTATLGGGAGGKLTDTFMSTNQYGYNIDLISVTGLNVPELNGITYWLNRQNAAVPSGDPVYWDENSGKGCGSSGCPSSASESALGTIPGEAFTINGGGGSGTTPEPSSIMLFGSGILGLAGVLRRKLF